jgi:hypothetical protein
MWAATSQQHGAIFAVTVRMDSTARPRPRPVQLLLADQQIAEALPLAQ